MTWNSKAARYWRVSCVLAVMAWMVPALVVAEGGKDDPGAPAQPPKQPEGGIVETLPEFNYEETGTFPSAPQTVGTFSYTIPPGEGISSATISGQWGNSVVGSSAPTEVYLDGILVATCLQTDPCYNNTVPWSFTFSPADFPQLADGSATMTAIQTAPFVIRLGVTTLDITTGVPTPTAPLWAIALLGVLLLAVSLWVTQSRRTVR